MRKIEFRAWDKKDKMMYPEVVGIDFYNGILDLHPDYNCKVVMRDCILMQYTGLKDKNGKEGYHKDIWTDGLHKYLVKWIDKKACFVLQGIIIKREYSMAHFIEGEIIGNIYENSELIKVEDL